MSKSTIGAVVIAGLLILGGSALATTATATSTPPAPPAPEWVNPDGTVNDAKLPDSLPVMGADGKTLKDANGNEVTVKTRLGPPQGDARSAQKSLPGEKRWTETDENGATVEHVEVEPTAPAAP
ncbi:hypothetical protein [Streptomyces sp. NPDC006355]|uniref:hypothetical protein n=1 Tax=Streptomyces sp. NPDC006355 TaxID=3156758 RepID=UPI0033B715F1